MIKLVDLLKENHKTEYGCVYLKFHILGFQKIQMKINKDDLYEDPNDDSYGLENNPHVTLLYGLHSDVSVDHVSNVINQFSDDLDTVNVKFSNISLFKPGNYEVLKFEAKSPLLTKINKELVKLPYTSDFPDYKPHMTVAYLKPGTGDKYVKEIGGLSFSETPTGCYYSQAGGKLTQIL